MRVNIYSQEITEEVNLISKQSNTGIIYQAIQFMLHSSPMLHHPPADDDRSAVTFWLPGSLHRKLMFIQSLRRAADMVELEVQKQHAVTRAPECPSNASGHDWAPEYPGYVCVQCGAQRSEAHND